MGVIRGATRAGRAVGEGALPTPVWVGGREGVLRLQAARDKMVNSRPAITHGILFFGRMPFNFMQSIIRVLRDGFFS